jgi:L-ascorbate metabolism protein UlaG (beta-lactamase superfamily)
VKIKWYGHSAFRLTTADGIRIIIDPYEPGGLGGVIRYDPITDPADVVLISHDHSDHNHTEGIRGSFRVIRKEGDYDIQGVKIRGIPTLHGAAMGRNLMFVVEADGVRVVHLGDIGHTLDQDTIAQLGKVDFLMIPVDGMYTITLEEATQMVNDIKPSLALPMHFRTKMAGSTIAGVDQFVEDKQHVRAFPYSEIEISRDHLPSNTEIILLQHEK